MQSTSQRKLPQRPRPAIAGVFDRVGTFRSFPCCGPLGTIGITAPSIPHLRGISNRNPRACWRGCFKGNSAAELTARRSGAATAPGIQAQELAPCFEKAVHRAQDLSQAGGHRVWVHRRCGNAIMRFYSDGWGASMPLRSAAPTCRYGWRLPRRARGRRRCARSMSGEPPPCSPCCTPWITPS